MTFKHRIELKKLDLRSKDKEKELVHEISKLAIIIGTIFIALAIIIARR